MLTRKILPILLAVIMVIGLVPVTVMADAAEPENEVIVTRSDGSEVTYSTLEAGMSAIMKDTTCSVKLLQDVEIEEPLTVRHENFTLNLNGHTLTANTGTGIIVNTGCSLTLKDGVLVVNNTGAATGIKAQKKYGNVIVTNCDIIVTGSGDVNGMYLPGTLEYDVNPKYNNVTVSGDTTIKATNTKTSGNSAVYGIYVHGYNCYYGGTHYYTTTINISCKSIEAINNNASGICYGIDMSTAKKDSSIIVSDYIRVTGNDDTVGISASCEDLTINVSEITVTALGTRQKDVYGVDVSGIGNISINGSNSGTITVNSTTGMANTSGVFGIRYNGNENNPAASFTVSGFASITVNGMNRNGNDKFVEGIRVKYANSVTCDVDQINVSGTGTVRGLKTTGASSVTLDTNGVNLTTTAIATKPAKNNHVYIADTNGVEVQLNKGTYNATTPGSTTKLFENCIVSGGTFNVEVPEKNIAAGSTEIHPFDDTWVVLKQDANYAAKVDAIEAVEDAAKKLDDVTDLSDAERKELQDAVDEAANAAIANIQKATTAYDITTAMNAGITAIEGIIASATADNAETLAAKETAKAAIAAAADTQKAAIAALENLDNETKNAYIAEITAAAKAATDDIDKATDVAGVNTAKDDGIENINGIVANATTADTNALTNAKAAAITEIKATAEAEKEKIRELSNLTSGRITEFNNMVAAKATAAIANINNAANSNGVGTAKDAGIAAIEAVGTQAAAENGTVTESKNEASGAITTMAQEKTDAIDKMGSLSDTEKDAYKQAITDAFNAANAAINGATDVAGVSLAQAKATAIMDLIVAEATAINEIKALENLDTDAKDAYIAGITTAANNAKAAIDGATDVAGVAAAKNGGIDAINGIVDAAKENNAPAEVVHTIILNANGGSVYPATIITNPDGTLASLPTPKLSMWYRFDGWFTAPTGGEKITTSTVFTEGTTLYARWTRITVPLYDNCTLYFETNEGTSVPDVIRLFSATVNLSRYTTTREGYTFTGWYLDEALTEKVTSMKLLGDTVLYAGWEKEEN